MMAVHFSEELHERRLDVIRQIRAQALAYCELASGLAAECCCACDCAEQAREQIEIRALPETDGEMVEWNRYVVFALDVVGRCARGMLGVLAMRGAWERSRVLEGELDDTFRLIAALARVGYEIDVEYEQKLRSLVQAG